jgi:hypothetical protein
MEKTTVNEPGARALDWIWHKRVEHSYGRNAGLSEKRASLLFILGITGSGIDWPASLFSHRILPATLNDEPLLGFEPKPVFTKKEGVERVSLPYRKSLHFQHPLLRISRILAHRNITQNNSAISLIKQTRALLGAEPLLRNLHAKTLFILNDPVRILDQLINLEGRQSPYLRLESNAVFADDFLSRFLHRDRDLLLKTRRIVDRIPDATERRMLRRLLCIALIQHMFRMLVARYPERAQTLSIDHLHYNPESFPLLATWLYGEGIRKSAESCLEELTFTPTNSSQRIWKSVPCAKGAIPVSLSAGEIQCCYQLLEDCGLPQQEKEFRLNPEEKGSSLYLHQRDSKSTPQQAA